MPSKVSDKYTREQVVDDVTAIPHQPELALTSGHNTQYILETVTYFKDFDMPEIMDFIPRNGL